MLFVEGHGVEGILAELALCARGLFPRLGRKVTALDRFDMGAFMALHGKTSEIYLDGINRKERMGNV
jgi:hypothetical protein